jgi:hypothetical protein
MMKKSLPHPHPRPHTHPKRKEMEALSLRDPTSHWLHENSCMEILFLKLAAVIFGLNY